MTHPLTDEIIKANWPDMATPVGMTEIRRQFDAMMAQIKAEALDPCKHCGGEAAYATIGYKAPPVPGSSQTEFYAVNCVKCGVSVGRIVGYGYPTKADARATWNATAPHLVSLTSPPKTNLQLGPYRKGETLTRSCRHAVSKIDMLYWSGRIECYGLNFENAEGLRDHIIAALEAYEGGAA